VRGRGGRTIQLHPQEALLQEARAFQASAAFRPYRALRQVAEHRLARMVQLGIRQARYRGTAKTLFQAFMVAAVANLTLIAASSDPNWRPFLLAAWFSAFLVALRTHWPGISRSKRPLESAQPLARFLTLTPAEAFKLVASRPDF